MKKLYQSSKFRFITILIIAISCVIIVFAVRQLSGTEESVFIEQSLINEEKAVPLIDNGSSEKTVIAFSAAVNKESSNPEVFTDIIYVKVNVREIGTDTGITWSFESENGMQYNPTSDIKLTYKYNGLRISGEKLTVNVIPVTNETKIFTNDVREYTIASGDLITVTDIVVSALFGDIEVESKPQNTSPIELRLFNIVYNNARNYGAIEMFSHGKSSPGGIGAMGPTVQPRGHTIINYKNGRPIDLYSCTFSIGHGGIAGNGDGTQHREWYYNGSVLYARTNGGNTNFSSGGAGATAPVKPNKAIWDSVNSVQSNHTSKWPLFTEAFKKNPWTYLSNDINTGYAGLYEYKFSDPTQSKANFTDGRINAPLGIIETDKRGALAHNNNGTFEFTFKLDPFKSGNRITIEWAGNVATTALGDSYITFVIDENMRFVKYHAKDSYTVDVLSVTTYTCATYYFVYHKDNINIDGYSTYRAHQLRPNHVNFVNSRVNPKTIIAPNDDADHDGMIVKDSKYDILLNWIKDCTTKVSIP